MSTKKRGISCSAEQLFLSQGLRSTELVYGVSVVCTGLASMYTKY